MAVLAGVAVAVTLGPDASAPDTEPSDTPTSTEPTPPHARLSRPVTTSATCPEPGGGCSAWRTAFPDVRTITPATAGADPRHAYVGAVLEDGGGALFAIDPTNGIQLWRRALPGASRQPLFAPWGAVVVAYDAPAGGTGLRSFNPLTGDLQWRLEDALRTPLSAGPAGAGNTLAMAGPGRMLLRPFTSRAVTIVELGVTPTGILAHQDDRGATFLVQTDREQVRAYTEDGALLWARTSSRLGTDVEDGRTAVLEAPDVVGLDVRTGEVWRTPVVVGPGPVVVDRGSVYVMTPDAELVRLSLTDGHEVGRVTLPGRLPAFTIDRETLLLPDCSEITALEVRTGETRWSSVLPDAEGRCATPPVAAPGDGLLLVSADDVLYGVRP